MSFNKILAITLALLCFVTSGCITSQTNNLLKANARVSNTNPGSMATDPPGVITYSTIQAAVDAAPGDGKAWTIVIDPGTFNERVVINKPGIHLVGSGKGQTRIAYGRYAGQAVEPGSDKTWGTSGSAVVEVNNTGTGLYDLTIENTFDYLANDKLPQDHPDKVRGAQAVALRTGEDSDKTVLQRVELLGFQDTLYVKGGRTYVTDSVIAGNIDFIFGDGNAVFDSVDIISLGRATKTAHTGYVTAPSTLVSNHYGLTFLNCRLLRHHDVPDNSVPLGRPWHPTTTFADGRYANPFAVGKSTFINTFMDAHITHEGWTSMGGTAKDGSKKQFDPMTEARFSEYNSYGPGAAIGPARPQLSETDLSTYQKDTILNNWQPQTLTPDVLQQLMK